MPPMGSWGGHGGLTTLPPTTSPKAAKSWAPSLSPSPQDAGSPISGCQPHAPQRGGEQGCRGAVLWPEHHSGGPGEWGTMPGRDAAPMQGQLPSKEQSPHPAQC